MLATNVFAKTLVDTPIDVIAALNHVAFCFQHYWHRVGFGSMMLRKPGKLPGDFGKVS